MKTKRIIDLLVDIAKGNKVPKIIKYHNDYFEYDEENQKYRNRKNSPREDLLKYIDFYKGIILNDSVEIIEDIPKEDKKIEWIGNDYYHKPQDEINQIFQRKINELIKRVNGEGND